MKLKNCYVLALFGLGATVHAQIQQPATARPNSREIALDALGYPTNAAVAHAWGQADARRDLAKGVVAIQYSGLPSSASIKFESLLAQRCHVKMEALGGCCVTEGLSQYERGYNELSEPTIMKQFGTNIFDSLLAEAEGNQLRGIKTRNTPSICKVRPGDTLVKIAKEQGVTVRALCEANPKVDPKNLQIGQKINLPPKPRARP